MSFKVCESERQRIPAMAALGPHLMKRIGISGLIDSYCPSSRSIVKPSNCIEVVAGVLFEGEQKPAVMNYSSYYVGTPTQKMFNSRIDPKNINATSISRSLDAIYELDRDELTWKCHELCSSYFGLESNMLFIDETNFAYYGDVPENVAEDCPIPAFGGNSKTKQNNVRQYDVLGVANGNGELVFSKPYDGNTSDKQMDKEAIDFIRDRVDPSLYTIVADSKMTDQNLIDDLIDGGFGFVLKVPKNYSDKLAERVVDVAKKRMSKSSRKGMTAYDGTMDTVNGPLRVVAYEFTAKTEKFAKDLIDKSKAKLVKALDGIEGHIFDSREEADDAITGIIESLGPIPFSIQANYRSVIVKEKWGKRGRPPKDWAPGDRQCWTVEPTFEVCEEIASLMAQDQGIQVLLTNLPARLGNPDPSENGNPRFGTTAEEVVATYLQEYNVEWIFRMMKSGSGVDTVYLRTPERECAMIFIISLVVSLKTSINARLKKTYGQYSDTIDGQAIKLRRLSLEYDPTSKDVYLVGSPELTSPYLRLLSDLDTDPDSLLLP